MFLTCLGYFITKSYKGSSLAALVFVYGLNRWQQLLNQLINHLFNPFINKLSY